MVIEFIELIRFDLLLIRWTLLFLIKSLIKRKNLQLKLN